jgi:hypothetical protein
MKITVYSGIAAVVLCAALGGAQTKQGTTDTSKGTTDTSNKGKQGPPSTASGASKTYNGCLESNGGAGYKLSNARSGKAAGSATVKPTPVVYELVLGDGTKVDLATMANEHVEIVGTIAPVVVNDKSGKPRVVTVQEIHVVPGGC